MLSLITFSNTLLRGQTNTSPKVSAMYIQAPIFKGLSYNPVIRLRIYVDGSAERKYRSIQLLTNKEVLESIEKLNVLMRADGEQVFVPTADVIGSASPSSTNQSIQVNLTCKPGINYVWISPVLKEGANIDRKLVLQMKTLTTDKGVIQNVSSLSSIPGQAPNYNFRMGVAVRKIWDDSVHTYRIPGIITTNKGSLIAVYDARYNNTRDLPEDIDVGMSRSTDGGKTWEPMKIIMDMGEPHANNGIGDPAVLFDPITKKIWVAALWSKGNRSIAGSEPGLSPDTTGQFVLVSSDDDGLTWSKPYNITAQVKNPIWHLYFQGPGNGIAMQDGTLVFPSQYWDETRKPGIPHSSIIYSTDHGLTWKSGIGAKSNTTESQVVETLPGTLMLNMRDNRGGYRSIATTKDMGKTWIEHSTSQFALPDPVCMASFIKAKVSVKGSNKEFLFFSNPASQNGRVQMSIKASPDLGESWPKQNELLIDSRRGFGYSALTRVDANTIGMLYEGERDLFFVRIPVRDIIK